MSQRDHIPMQFIAVITVATVYRSKVSSVILEQQGNQIDVSVMLTIPGHFNSRTRVKLTTEKTMAMSSAPGAPLLKKRVVIREMTRLRAIPVKTSDITTKTDPRPGSPTSRAASRASPTE